MNPLSVLELNQILNNVNSVNFDGVVSKIIQQSSKLTNHQQEILVNNFFDSLNFILPIRPKAYRKLAEVASCIFNFISKSESEHFQNQISKKLSDFPIFICLLMECGVISSDFLSELSKNPEFQDHQNEFLIFLNSNVPINKIWLEMFNALITDNVSYFYDRKDSFDFCFALPNEKESKKIPLFVASAIFGAKNTFKLFLDKGIDPSSAEYNNYFGGLGQAAVMGGSLDIIRMLERKGVSIQYPEIAARFQYKEILTYILIKTDPKKKSDPNLKKEVEQMLNNAH